MKYTDIMKETGCSKKTVSKYCMQAGLSENPKKIDEITPEILEFAQKRYDEIGNIKKVAKELHVSYQRLVDAGLQIKEKVKKERKDGELTPQASCAQKAKIKAIEYKGSKCLVCGYNKSVRALQFHHLDPIQKDFGISGNTKSFEKLKPELDKCVLLCANCHAEVHDNLINLNDYL
jgi:5-methylcytosine-specific restriction endonuclease McrA